MFRLLNRSSLIAMDRRRYQYRQFLRLHVARALEIPNAARSQEELNFPQHTTYSFYILRHRGGDDAANNQTTEQRNNRAAIQPKTDNRQPTASSCLPRIGREHRFRWCSKRSRSTHWNKCVRFINTFSKIMFSLFSLSLSVCVYLPLPLTLGFPKEKKIHTDKDHCAEFSNGSQCQKPHRVCCYVPPCRS